MLQQQQQQQQQHLPVNVQNGARSRIRRKLLEQPWLVQVDGRLWHHEDAGCRFNSIDPPIRVPSISLPAGVTESGLPIGLQLQGTPGELQPQAGQPRACPCGQACSWV